MIERKKLLNQFISKITFVQTIEAVFKLSEESYSSYICFANVHMVMEGYRNEEFRKVLTQADLVTPDGVPVSKMVSYIYNYKQERVAGLDLLPVLLVEAARRNKSVYFYGSTEKVLNAISFRIRRELPKLKIAGLYSPPFRELTHQEDMDIVEQINNSKPDLVCVALGCPKQEKWMAKNKGKINACMLGFGQAFVVYAGLEKRPPIWMRNLSLEWTYRLYLEPRRLWKRYLVNNSLFIILMIKLGLLKVIFPQKTNVT